ncbi:MAG: hypothetical protein IPI73_30895 [Betaproteobacteria bacterium]|nr:hypothetical protein [Betaproteobacteria bacterium]
MIRQNGIRIATWTKMIEPWPGVNQIAARIAQPIDGNGIQEGLDATAQLPVERRPRALDQRQAAADDQRQQRTDASTRTVEASVMDEKSASVNNASRRFATATGPGRDDLFREVLGDAPDEQAP